MKSSLFILHLFSVLSASCSPLLHRADQPTVFDSSAQVTYIGNSSNGVESFMNIKFGQDTGGDNRFKAPQAYAYPQSAVVDASVPGAACPQQMEPVKGIPIFDNMTNVSEDCLSLRIDRPANTSDDVKLPVMVYIYGGGFNVGQVYDSAYTPTLLVAGAAAKNTPVIYVAMNYRVGVFGFASTSAISQDDLNAGLLDQRLALQWIQKNIHLFGGDPDNVTVFGESAGADSIGLHLVSYAGNTSMRPPFQRAIMQSGGPTSQLHITSNETANHTTTIISQLNCTSTTSNSTEELTCLQATPLSTLLEISTKYSLSLNPLGGFNTFSPVVPSTLLPSAPSTLLASGLFHKNISLISGWTENDGSLFVPPPSTLRTEQHLTQWLSTSNLTPAAITTLLTLYPSTSFPSDPESNITSHWFRASQIDRDRESVCPSLLINSAMANTSSPRTRNYLYALNATLFAPFFARANAAYLGVMHFSDIGFVFNQAAFEAYNASGANIELASEVSGSWASFAGDGNAQGQNGSVMHWEEGAVQGEGDGFGVRVLGGSKDGMARIGAGHGGDGAELYDENLVERCRFWNSMEVLEMNGT